MVKRLLPLVAVFSGLMCVAVLVVWLRSGLYVQALEYTNADGKTYEISSGRSGMRDGLHIGTMTSTLIDGGEARWSLGRDPLPAAPKDTSKLLGYPPRWSALGFKYCEGEVKFSLAPTTAGMSRSELGGIEGSHRIRRMFLVVPYWAAVLVTAILPAIWLLRQRRNSPNHPVADPDRD